MRTRSRFLRHFSSHLTRSFSKKQRVTSNVLRTDFSFWNPEGYRYKANIESWDLSEYRSFVLGGPRNHFEPFLQFFHCAQKGTAWQINYRLINPAAGAAVWACFPPSPPLQHCVTFLCVLMNMQPVCAICGPSLSLSPALPFLPLSLSLSLPAALHNCNLSERLSRDKVCRECAP